MGVLRAIVIPLFAAWTLCVASVHSAAQDAPPAPPPPRVVKSADGSSSVSVPGDWEINDAPVPEKTHLINVVATAPGDTEVRLWSTDYAGGATSEMAAAADYAAYVRGLGEFASVSVGAQPFPHVITVSKTGTPAECRLYRFLLAGRTLMRVEAAMRCATPDDLLPGLRAMIASFAAGPRDGMPPPARYVRNPKSAVEWWTAPGVKAGDATKLQAKVAAHLAAAAKRFGRSPGPGILPARVFCHANRKGCEAYKDAYESGDSGIRLSLPEATLHICPLDEKDERAWASLAQLSTMLSIEATFGTVKPRWFSISEELLAYAEVLTGKPYPSMPSSFQSLERMGKMDTLAVLDAMEAAKLQESRRIDAIAHLVMLRDTMPEYRAALLSFCEVLAKTGDPAEAMKPLLAFDQAQIAKEAQWYFKNKTVWDYKK